MEQIRLIGKKYAIYIPRKIAKQLNLKEGDKVLISVQEDKIIIKPLKRLFIKRKYWSETSLREIEQESEELSKMIEDED
ncbi:MAG: AbrB/MazE/SpoVT family DNA-binding domain-containing protein [Candidatus Njordarchaeales archaeon]